MQVGKPFYLVAGSKRGIVLHQGLWKSTRSKANKVQAGHTNNAVLQWSVQATQRHDDASCIQSDARIGVRDMSPAMETQLQAIEKHLFERTSRTGFLCVYKKWNSDDWFIFLKHLNYPKILAKKRPKVRRPTTSLPRAGPNVPWHPGARDLLLRSHLRTGLGPGKNETIPGLFLDPHQPCNSGLQL